MTLRLERRPASRPAEAELGGLIRQALRQTPDRCAFRFADATLSCHELLCAARATARALERHGLAPGEPVALHIDHSLDLVVGICGIALAGGCAVPIDPGLSSERQRAILTDIAPRLLVVASDGTSPPGSNAVTIPVHRDAKPEDFSPRNAATGTDPAFIIYTSGTSGGPKGVVISQENYVSRMQHIIAANQWDDTDIDLAWTPSSFIGMLDEIFFPLLMGAPAVIASPEVRTDAQAFGALIRTRKITRFRITPSLLRAFLNAGIHDDLAAVRAIYCSGEPVPADLQRQVHSLLDAGLTGFYGATEAPGIAFHAFDPKAPPLDRTICTAQPFARLRIMTDSRTEADPGDAGEIWISSPAVALGYWRRPALSAEKFVNADGRRWYRTGDLGRALAGGRFELIGRRDMSEVNIHGVRINLSEIRHALEGQTGIRQAWVSVIGDNPESDPVLIGHCVSAGNVDPEALRSALIAHLPALAVPRMLIAHDQFPLTANGKLDVQALAALARKRLRSPAPAQEKAGETRATPTEIAVLNCFEKALERKRISVEQNFFDAGGNSLQAVTLAGLVSDHFKTEISFRDIWLHPSARALTHHIETRGFGGSARTFLHVEGQHGPNLLAIGFGVSHLAGLWPDRRLFVSPGITGDPRISFRKRLDDYVSEYLEGLRRVQPEGPYQLIGFSFCGLLAYELARRLHAEGARIRGIALIEPLTPCARMAGRSYGRVLLAETIRALASRKRGQLRRLSYLARYSLARPAAAPPPYLPHAYGHLVAAAEQLAPCPCPIDLIHAEGFSAKALQIWQDVAGDALRLHKVSADDHTSLIKPACVRQWHNVVAGWNDGASKTNLPYAPAAGQPDNRISADPGPAQK